MMMYPFRKLFALCLVFSAVAGAVDIVSENQRTACEEIRIQRELRIYKDPTIFLPNLAMIYRDAEEGWAQLLNESPLLTTVTKGTFQIMRLGPAREFKDFGAIAKIYELAEPKFRVEQRGKRQNLPIPKIIPVKICLASGYNDTLGFVLESDLVEAQKSERNEKAGMPPSVFPNPVPTYTKPN